MFISAILLVVLAVGVCLTALRMSFKLLRLDPMQTFVWLGLAEVPAPRTRRRSSHT